MNEQEVWVRMMAAIYGGQAVEYQGCRLADPQHVAELVGKHADAAVAEWRKRYGKPVKAKPEAPAEPTTRPFKPGDLVSVVSGYYKGQDGSVATVYPDDDDKHPGVISVLLPGCAPHFRAEHLKHR